MKEESNETFAVPNVDLITDEISKAKVDAIEVCKSCDMVLNSYEDKDLVQNVKKVIEEAIQHDHKSNEGSIIENDDSSGPSEVAMTQEDIVTINEHLSIIKLQKKASSVGLPTYMERTTPCLEQPKIKRSLRKVPRRPKRNRFHRLFYTKDPTYERAQLCIYYKRIAKSQAIASCASVQNSQAIYMPAQKIELVLETQLGDLCIFTRVDCEKCLLGRIIQFSYLTGAKKERQYSSNFVDLTKESYKSIGVYANWFQGTRALNNQDFNKVSFKPVELVFTPGYLPMSYYIASIDDSTLLYNADFSFSIPVEILKTALPRWRVKMTFDMT